MKKDNKVIKDLHIKFFDSKAVDLFCYLLVFIITFFASLQSNSNPFVYHKQAADSSVFQYVAKMMLNGYLPYRDTFDHKGPLLYLINCLGLVIDEKWGIWVLEFIALFFTYIFLYMICILRCNKIISLIILLISYASLGDYIYGGNFCEEYALPFISASLYVFLDYFIHGKISNIRLIMCGLGFGAVLLLRPNMAGMWPIMCLGVLIYCISKKQIADLFRFLLLFMIGVLIVALPIFIWLEINGILLDCWDCYIKFNMLYSQSDISDKFLAYGLFQMDSPVMISIIICFFEALYRKSIKPIGYMILILISLVFVALPGVAYSHYGLVLIPIVLYPYAMLLSTHEFTNKIGYNIYVCASVIIVLFLISNPNSEYVYDRVGYDITHIGENYYPEEYEQIVDIVNEYTTNDDRILFFGNLDRYYLLTDRFSISRFSYQSPIFDHSRELGWSNTFFDELSDDPPIIIGVLTEKAYICDRNKMNMFLDLNGYIEMLRTDDVTIYLME